MRAHGAYLSTACLTPAHHSLLSIMSAAIARDANLCVKPTLTELRNASNGVMTLLGEAETVLCYDRHSARTVVLVASDLSHSALIGWQDLQKLRVIPASFPAVAAFFFNPADPRGIT